MSLFFVMLKVYDWLKIKVWKLLISKILKMIKRTMVTQKNKIIKKKNKNKFVWNYKHNLA